MTNLQWFIAATLLLPFGAASAATSTSMDVPVTITAPSGTGNEEFVGPFANWLNVKTTADCGATGNGSTDDTVAIQNCINKLSSTTPVLYFPAGTYKITSTLTLNNQYVSLIGADPSTTTILWGGAANAAAMLQLTSTSYSRVDRLTFNGNNNVGVLIDDDAGSGFNTGNEYADDVFINAGGTYNGGTSIDLACGWLVGASALSNGGGCAQIAILRGHFTNGVDGVVTGNYNAGDVWVWYSTFTNKHIGLRESQGDLHAFQNNFFNSSAQDININPEAEHTFDWNYSSASNQFINCATWTNAFTATIIEGNTVVNTTSPQAIECDDQGPTIVIDNAIYSKAGATTPVIRKAAATTSDLLSTGNTFSTISGGVLNECGSSSDYVQSIGRCHSLGDQTTSASPPSAPTLPGVPPQYCASGCPNTVSVQEVAAGASTTTIQNAINAAAAMGNGAVVHLQAGTYAPTTTLSVPGNTFIQIIGDGGYTAFNGGSLSAASPILTCGPVCKAWFRDFRMANNSINSAGLQITGADQAGGRVFIEQPYTAIDNTGILINGLRHTNVEIHDGSLAGDGTVSGDTINVVGGTGPNSSYTNVFATGSSCDNNNFVRTSGNANFTLRHMWHERGGCIYSRETIAQVAGSGAFAMAGARTYIAGCTPNPCTSLAGHYFNLTSFSGTSAIVGILPFAGDSPADVYITGASAGKNLVLGYAGCNSTGPSFTDTATNDVYYLLDPQINSLAGCVNQVTSLSNTGALVTESSQNVSNLLSFLNTTLAPLRAALPTVPGASGDPASASGVTDARIYRVYAIQVTSAIDVER